MLAMGNGHANPSRRAFRSAHAARAVSASAHGVSVTPAKHIIVEANGLFGYTGNWDVINQYLTKRLDMDHYMIYASKINQKADTFDGIDICGKRLAQEIQQVVAANPQLEYISMVGHSMGGLILRYAAGYLYDKDEQLISGLTPVHFITMATPHLGCDSTEGEHQVPLVKWLGVSRSIASVLDRLCAPVTGIMFGLSGQQLFMVEPEALPPRTNMQPQRQAKPPLLLRLAFDVPGEGHFFSALRAFHSRTCYGNVGRDHLVGWANSTLRFTDELPQLNLRDRVAVPTAKGVILEDPPHSAADPVGSAGQGSASSRGPPAALAGDELPPVSQAAVPLQRPTEAAGGGVAERLSAVGAGADAGRGAILQDMHVRQALDQEVQGSPVGVEDLVRSPRAAQSTVVLQRLRSLGWARVDCAWRDARLGAFAHNHIQAIVQGVMQGKSVCDHLAKRFLQLEDGVAGCNRSYTLPLTARQGGSGSGDMSSRQLSQQLDADRPPPE